MYELTWKSVLKKSDTSTRTNISFFRETVDKRTQQKRERSISKKIINSIKQNKKASSVAHPSSHLAPFNFPDENLTFQAPAKNANRAWQGKQAGALKSTRAGYIHCGGMAVKINFLFQFFSTRCLTVPLPRSVIAGRYLTEMGCQQAFGRDFGRTRGAMTRVVREVNRTLKQYKVTQIT